MDPRPLTRPGGEPVDDGGARDNTHIDPRKDDMTDTDDLETDDLESTAIGDDQLPDDDEEFGAQPAPASAVPVEPVMAP
jgi:hypothetical protein